MRRNPSALQSKTPVRIFKTKLLGNLTSRFLKFDQKIMSFRILWSWRTHKVYGKYLHKSQLIYLKLEVGNFENVEVWFHSNLFCWKTSNSPPIYQLLILSKNLMLFESKSIFVTQEIFRFLRSVFSSRRNPKSHSSFYRIIIYFHWKNGKSNEITKSCH